MPPRPGWAAIPPGLGCSLKWATQRAQDSGASEAHRRCRTREITWLPRAQLRQARLCSKEQVARPRGPRQRQDWAGRGGGQEPHEAAVPPSHRRQSRWPQSPAPGGVSGSSETKTQHGRSEASLPGTCTPNRHPGVSTRESRRNSQCRSCCWGQCWRQHPAGLGRTRQDRARRGHSPTVPSPRLPPLSAEDRNTWP